MGLILALIGAAVVGVIGFGVTWLVAGRDPGIGTAEPDSVAVPLPTSRPLTEGDIQRLRFDTTMRGYRMGQVDAALRRAAYDIGYKEELINVLEAEVQALRDGRHDDAETLRRARNVDTESKSKPAEQHAPAAPSADRVWAARSDVEDGSEPSGDDGDDDHDDAGKRSVDSANGAK